MTHSPALTDERHTSPPQLPKRRTSPAKRKQRLAAYLFLVPFFIVFITMLVIPLAYSGYLSLFESRLIGVGINARREGQLTRADAREARRSGFAAAVQWAPWPPRPAEKG